MSSKPLSFSVMVIGNEILYGERQDTHSYWLAKRLSHLGFTLKQIQVLPDQLLVLVPAIRTATKEADYVITLGGIGATHDDLTRQAVAKALKRPLAIHQEMLALLKKNYGPKMNEGKRRLALLPKGCNIWALPIQHCYGFQCGHVISLPGFPELSRPLLQHFLPKLPGVLPTKARDFSRRSLLLFVGESKLVRMLDQAEQRFPKVSIGSYPEIHPEGPRVVLRFRGAKQGVAQAVAWVSRELQKLKVPFQPHD